MSPELSAILVAVTEAGRVIQAYQQKGFTIALKANNDLLTQADLAANQILKDHLSQHFPEAGWLSEESVDQVDRLACEQVFVIDPIDGTIEFAKGIPEYAISVALVKQGKPILAVVFNPAQDELFYAEKGKGAWLNDQPISCDNTSAPHLVLLASRSEDKRGEWDRFKEQHQVKVVGSIAYKLALIAAGQAHATFSLGPKNEWDIAAGVLLVEEAGGKATTKDGNELIFNQQRTLVDGIVACASAQQQRVMEMIANK